MVMQKLLNDTMDHTLKMARKYELNKIVSDIDLLKSQSRDFKLKVILVGSFSAGKSALINAMLKRELLEEGQRPETSIASELVYSDEEYIEAMKEGRCESKFSLEDVKDINTEEYDYLIWHINNETLRQFEDCTIVDFPGFNSGIKSHNKAITQYAGKGNAYLLVIDCEDGTIKQNITKFVEEIQNYDDNISIVVSKADLKTEEDMNKILNNVKKNAALIFGSNINVVKTSKFDKDVSEKVQTLIGQFDRQRIFKQSFFPRGYEIIYKCKDSIEVYRDSLELDLSEFDKEIEKHELCKKQLCEQLEKDRDALGKQLKNQVAPAIFADVQSALYNNVDMLANSLSGGERAFSLAVNNILRPVLMTSTHTYVEKSFAEFVTNISIDNSDIDDSVKEISKDAISKYQMASEKIQEIAKNGEKFNAAYKAVTTTLAVATSVIAPWLELVLIFLPDILKLLGVGKKEESMKNKVNNEIIPQLLDKIQPEIEKSLVEMKEKMVESLVENVNELLDSEVEALENAKAMREKKSEEHDIEIEKINEDLELLNGIMQKLA